VIRYDAPVIPQAADDVWARIDAAARQEPGGLVATDGDGTLWSGDVGDDLFLAFLEQGRVKPAAVEAFRHEARRHDLSDAGTGVDIARRIYAAYHEGRFPEEGMCELMTWCFAGWTRGEARAFARGVVERAGLAGRLQAELLRVLDRARAAGLEVVLVSASPVDVVLEAGALVGFDEAHVVAALPRYAGDVMTADVERPIPYGPGKVSRLRERIGQSRVLYAAFGDNIFDVAMLASARVPVAVRPKARLRSRAAEIPGVVELAPLAEGPAAAALRTGRC
jgi:phosphoserine phosphatase